MTLPDLHLAEDALAAYVDGTLSAAADDRAARHLRACAECREAVDAGREAKALLGATPDPALPAGLLSRLLDVPMTADLGSSDRVLAVDGDTLGWATGGRSGLASAASTWSAPSGFFVTLTTWIEEEP